MRCTLLIPHLFWPQEAADAVCSGLQLPGLQKLLARGRAERFGAITPEAWLCQAFQVERQQDWPVAPLTLALDGGESGDAYWLRADPVHLKMERERLVLIDDSLFDVKTEDAQTFVSVLNEHFKSEEILFHAPTPKRWYVRLAKPPNLITHTPGTAAGGDVKRFLPTGADALVWHRRFNEIQMLLYDHPANASREDRGEPPINSVWFWGGGVHPHVPGRPYDAVWSDEPLAVALAAMTDASAEARPRDAAAWLAAARQDARTQSSHLVVLNDLAAAVAYHDSNAWRERITALEADWIAPLLRELAAGRLARIVLVTPGETGCWRFEVARADLLKFWRTARRWSEYA